MAHSSINSLHKWTNQPETQVQYNNCNHRRDSMRWLGGKIKPNTLGHKCVCGYVWCWEKNTNFYAYCYHHVIRITHTHTVPYSILWQHEKKLSRIGKSFIICLFRPHCQWIWIEFCIFSHFTVYGFWCQCLHSLSFTVCAEYQCMWQWRIHKAQTHTLASP